MQIILQAVLLKGSWQERYSISLHPLCHVSLGQSLRKITEPSPLGAASSRRGMPSYIYNSSRSDKANVSGHGFSALSSKQCMQEYMVPQPAIDGDIVTVLP